MKIQDLAPNPKNPRTITEKKLDLLSKALREFGDLSGVVYNRRSKQLIGGHQRIKTLPDAEEIVITERYDEPLRTGTVAVGYIEVDGERFTYREVDWDPIREKAANLAANKGAGEWNYTLLTEFLLELDTHNFNLELTMFDDEEIQRIMGSWDSDIEAIDKIEENLDGITATIKITCPQDLKDEVLIYLKEKFLETSFEGVHIA